MRYAEKLFNEFRTRSKKLGKIAKDQLRFLTILHSVEPLDDKLVRAAVAKMERSYNRVLGKAAVWSRGAIELEIVNLTLLRRIGELDDDEIKTVLQAELRKGGTFKSGKKAKTVDWLGEM